MSKPIVRDDKILFHIQSITDWHDDPYDIFVWAKQEPSEDEVLKLYLAENDGLTLSDDQAKDFADSANVYFVYAEEL